MRSRSLRIYPRLDGEFKKKDSLDFQMTRSNLIYQINQYRHDLQVKAKEYILVLGSIFHSWNGNGSDCFYY